MSRSRKREAPHGQPGCEVELPYVLFRLTPSHEGSDDSVIGEPIDMRLVRRVAVWGSGVVFTLIPFWVWRALAAFMFACVAWAYNVANACFVPVMRALGYQAGESMMDPWLFWPGPFSGHSFFTMLQDAAARVGVSVDVFVGAYVLLALVVLVVIPEES